MFNYVHNITSTYDSLSYIAYSKNGKKHRKEMKWIFFKYCFENAMSASLCVVCKQGSTCPISETKSSTQIFGREFGLNFSHFQLLRSPREKIQWKKTITGNFEINTRQCIKTAKLKL